MTSHVGVGGGKRFVVQCAALLGPHRRLKEANLRVAEQILPVASQGIPLSDVPWPQTEPFGADHRIWTHGTPRHTEPRGKESVDHTAFKREVLRGDEFGVVLPGLANSPKRVRTHGAVCNAATSFVIAP